MAKTRNMTGNRNHDDNDTSSSSKKSFDKGDVASWSDLNHDVLFLVMMQLGFVDFFAFSGVCKSWRSLALSRRSIYMASIPPMSIRSGSGNQDSYWHLKDFKKKTCKTIIPDSAGRRCFGLTCGYLILFSKETRDFLLVNPITRHELRFPFYPLYVRAYESIRAILVFSPSVSGWVFVVLNKKLSFCMEGKRGWNHVSSTLPIIGLQYFKGKIYTLHTDLSVCELRLDLNGKRKWMLFESKNFTKPDISHPELVSSGEKLYLTCEYSEQDKVLELDIGEMKWVSPEKTIGEYAFFLSSGWKKSSAAIRPESWAAAHPTQYKTYDYFLHANESRKRHWYYYEPLWYFPHDCLTVNILVD
ncbi:hypothetical protein Lser_V15G32979 [Lactuca serriola]